MQTELNRIGAMVVSHDEKFNSDITGNTFFECGEYINVFHLYKSIQFIEKRIESILQIGDEFDSLMEIRAELLNIKIN